MAMLYISLFGRFSARHDEHALTGLGAGKVQELFCYLLLHRTRPSTREAVASLLWDHTTTVQAKSYLRSTLWKLQSLLKKQLGLAGVLLTSTDWIQCNPDFDLWLDVETLERAYLHVKGKKGDQLKAEEAQRLKEAIELYEGDLLENYYQDWCFYEREHLRHLYFVLLDKVTDYCEARHYYETATSYANRSLALDQARERTHRQLMRLKFLAGDRTGALHQYQQCVDALRDKLDIAPSEATIMLMAQIRAGQLEAFKVDHFSGRIPAIASPCDHLAALKEALDSLDHMRDQVRRKVEALERSLTMVGSGRGKAD